MSRVAYPDQRFDFRGGVNRSRSADSLDATELRYGRNMRREESGGLRKRPGSKRIHTDQLGGGAQIMGGFQWQNPGAAEELIVVADADLFYKSLAATTWTKVDGTLSTTVRPRFRPHRDGTNIVLYWADGGAINKWTGSALTENIAGSPASRWLELYKGRFFASTGKKLYWGQINEPENWAGGSSADVETFDTLDVLGGLTVGSSLCLYKRNNISRFTGVSNQTIRIDRESEGISPEVGLLAPDTLIAVEDWGFFLSDRGPYFNDEARPYFIGDAIEKHLRAVLDWTNVANSIAGFDRAQRKVHLAYPISGSSGKPAEGWTFDLNTKTWEGPHDYQGSWNPACFFRHERADKTETILVGGYDGRIRDGWPFAPLWKDDVLNDGSGGTPVPAKVTLPDLLGGDPARVKSLRDWQNVSCDLDDDGQLYIDWTNEDGEAGTIGPIVSEGAGVNDYPWKSKGKGKRLTISFREETANDYKFNGVSLQLKVGGQ